MVDPDLQSLFSSAALKIGHGLVATNAVHSMQQRDGGKIVTAIVSASPEDKSYRVYVRDLGDGGIHTECSCGRSPACEHAAAVLLSLSNPKNTVHGGATIEVPATHSQIATPTTDQQLLYILNPGDDTHMGLPVDTVVVRQLHGGGYSKSSRFSPQRADKNKPARFLQPEDFEIMSELTRLPTAKDSNSVVLSGHDSDKTLRSIIRTGRCHLREAHSPSINFGDARPLSLDWDPDQTGVQHVRWCASPSATYLFVLANTWYLDQSNHVAGILTSDLPQPLTMALLEQPSWEPQEAKQLKAWIEEQYPHVQLPQLRSFESRTVTATPVASLRFFSMEVDSGWENASIIHRAELFFKYEDIDVSHHSPATTFDGNTLIHIQRDFKFEQQCKRRLLNFGFYSVPNKGVPDKDLYGLSDDPAQWIDFQYDVVCQLVNENWRILFDPSFQLRAVRSQNWYCDVRRSDDTDWFDFSIGVVINGERINLLPVLLDFLRAHPLDTPMDLHSRNFALQIREQQWLRIPAERMQVILNTLISLYSSKSRKTVHESLHLPLYQLANIRELTTHESASISEWSGDTELRSLSETLRNAEAAASVSIPPTLKTELRHYQQSGLNWLQFLREQHMGGILADDMGLGKTVQTIAHLLVEKQKERMDQPSLIIAPTSLVYNWRNELRHFAPSLSVICLHGTNRHQHFNSIAKHEIVISSYPLLIRDQSILLSFNYHYLILDEAHYIKNPNTQAARCVRKLQARHKLCLTGTPLENHLGELWSLFDFLLPGFLGNQKHFQTVFRTPIEKHADTERAESLKRRLRPFILRRTKDEVAGDLPPKTEIVRNIALTQNQQDLYETVRLSVHHQVRRTIEHEGLARSHITVLDALLKLRQVCCDPRLVKLEKPLSASDSAKLVFLAEILPEMIEERRRILLFSQFTSMLALIENEIKKLRIDYVKLTGQTADRGAQIERFQSGEVPLFLISLKAGGVGLNLTAADTVIHYDPWWNPAVEHQATDRAHRIGQTKPVFVYKLICEGTVEEKIIALQENKQALADSLFQTPQYGSQRFSEQDIDELLAPLE